MDRLKMGMSGIVVSKNGARNIEHRPTQRVVVHEIGLDRCLLSI